MADPPPAPVLTSAYPPPPPFYIHHTAENKAALATTENPSAHPELRYLVPPAIPKSGYNAFGEFWPFPERNATLEELKVTRLYGPSPPSSPNPTGIEATNTIDRIRELRRLAKSLLLVFLELVGTLGVDPEGSQDLTGNLQTILFNMHYLINWYRPHQARETLCLMMEEQLARMREETAGCKEAVKRVEEVLQKVEEVGRAVGEAKKSEEDVRREGPEEKAMERDREGWQALLGAVGEP